MKEPTYSVFVRFRRGQRLTLKRGVRLEVALRFASEVRAERFHNPDDVFIIDDVSGEAVTDADPAREGAREAVIASPDPAAAGAVAPLEPRGSQSGSARAGRWRVRHAELSIRGAQRLTSSVERLLAELSRLTDHLRQSQLFEGEMDQLTDETARTVDQVRGVREALDQLSLKLKLSTTREDPPEPALVAQRQPRR